MGVGLCEFESHRPHERQLLRRLFFFRKINYLCRKRNDIVEKKEQKNFFVKMMEDKKAIIKSIRDGVPTKEIEEERDVKFATPV